MKLGKTLDVRNREKWRAWLEKNHALESEIWLVYYRKASGKPRIPYNELGAARTKHALGKVPPDIEKALRKDPEVWRNFRRFPETYRRIRVGWIDGARRRPDAFRTRLDYFLKKTKRNDMFGMVR